MSLWRKANNLWSSGIQFVVTKLIQLYADCDDLDSSRKLFDVFPKPNVFAWTAILGFFSRNGMYEDCLENYGLMKSQGVSEDHLVFPEVMKACAQLTWLDGGMWVHGDSALQLFGGLKLEGIKPDVITFNMLMDAYFRMGLCDEASKVFEQIEAPDIISWTTLISGYSRAGKYATCLIIFKDMVNGGGIFPDVDSLSLILVSCRHLPALMCGKAIHGYGIKTQQPGGRFYRSAGPDLMTMYARCDSFHYARTVFALMDRSHVVAWNTMILAFVESESRDLALECFGCFESSQDMKRVGVHADALTFTSVLSACHHSGLVEEGIELFESMTGEYGFVPTMEHYSCVVNMLARVGRLEAPINFIHQMPLEPDKSVWGALLTACLDQQNVEVGKLAAEKLIQLEPGRAGHYVALYSIYAEAGRWDDAVKVRKEMEGRGSVKPSGQSWITIGN
ncbi:unnamed protein product [Linum trigynum]|uniref:Pentatricopeptide repeat-containing protein n=1 Tax=Linum trigynum TaxID=586398 RepID=A0AAV2CRE1_9ROSI